MANDVVLQCLFTHQYNTDKPYCISESVIGSYSSCDGGNSNNGGYRSKYFSKSSSLIVGKNKCNKPKRQTKYRNLKYPKQELIFAMNSEQCSESEISLKTSRPYSLSTTYIIDSDVATETSYVIKKSKSSVTTNIVPPFYTEYIVGNVCRKCKSKECKDPYKNPTVRARIYECQLKVAQERRPCSCDSDIHFEVMKGLYECYKNKDCGNCNCILCGHLPCENIDITRDNGRGETFLKGTPNSNQHNIKNALAYTADHGLPLPKGRTKSQKKLIQEVIERRNKKVKALEDLIEKGTGCGTCKVPDCINPLLNPAVRATLLKCQMRSADTSCCCACKSGIIYKVMKGMYDCYKSKDSGNCKCILCGHLPCEGLGETSNSGKDFLTVDKIPLSEKPKIVKENLLQCLTLIATKGMHLPKGRTESEKELIDKAEDNAIEDLLKSGEPLTASVKLKIEKRNEIKKHHIGISPEPIDKIEKTKTVPKEADKSAVAILDGKTLAQKEKITRSLERKGVDLAEGIKRPKKQLTETYQKESHSETTETENAKIQEKKFAKKNIKDVSQSVSSLTDEDRKLKDKKKLKPERSVSDTLLFTEKTKMQEYKQHATNKTEKKHPKKIKKDVSLSVSSLTDEDKKLEDKRKLHPERSVSDNLLVIKKNKIQENKQRATKHTQMKLVKKSEKDISRSVSSLTDEDKKLKDKKKFQPKRSVSDTLLVTEKTKIQEYKQHATNKTEKKHPKKSKKDVSLSVSSLTDEDKKLEDKRKLHPERSVSDNLLVIKKNKIQENKQRATKNTQMKLVKKSKKDISRSVSSLTDEDKKLKNKKKFQPKRSVSDTLLVAEKTKMQEDKQQVTKKTEKKHPRKSKKDVSRSVSSLTDEDKQLKDKKQLQPERSVSDTLLATKTKKVKAEELEEKTEKKLDKKFLDKKEKVPKLDSFTETKSKKVKAKQLKEKTEKKLDKKGRRDLSRSAPYKFLDNEERAQKEISLPTFEELKNKSPKQKEKILKALANQYLPLPEPRSKSERQLYQKVIKETAPRSFSDLEGKTPEDKEKILKNLANSHVPLPEPKTKSEMKLVAKIYREIPTPTFSEFKHKQPEEKEQLLKHYAKQNIQLPKAKTSSEKELVEKIVTEIPPSTITAIKDRTPSEKEMILKTMAKHNIPLPEPQSASEKKMIDKVLREAPPPPPPPSKIDLNRKSPKEGKKQTAASSYEETKSFTPSKERKIVEKAAKALEKSLKEEEKRRKLEATEAESKQSQEKLAKDMTPRTFSDLEGKSPKEKEKILKNMAMQKKPLPVPQTKSQERLIDKINKQIPPLLHHGKDTESFTPSKERKIVKQGAKALEKTSKEERKRGKLEAMDQQSQEKVAINIIPRTFSDLEGKGPKEKEKILKNMAMQKIPLPVPQTKSQERLIDKINKQIPPPLHHDKDTESFTPSKERNIVKEGAKALERASKEERKRGKIEATEGQQSKEKVAKDIIARTFSDLEGKGTKEKEKILKNMAMQKIPLPVPQTKSQERLIDKINKQIPPPLHHDKDTESFTPSKERNIVKEGAKALERASKEERKRGKIEATEGQQSKEKVAKDMMPRTFSDLEGKSPKEKEKILKNMAMQKIPLPVPQTKSQERLIDKINKQIPQPSHHGKDTKSLKPGKRVKSSGTEVNLSPEMKKQNILRSKAQQHIPLAEPKTSSEKKMIEKLLKGGGKIVCECKDSHMDAAKKLEVAEDLSPKQRASEVLMKKSPKTKSDRVAKKPKITDVDRAKKLEVAEDLSPKQRDSEISTKKSPKTKSAAKKTKITDVDAARKLEVAEHQSPKLRSSEVLIKKSSKTKSGLTAKKPKRKPRKCNQACGCDLLEPQFKERVVRIHVTSPDISAFCPCPGEEPPCVAPHILSGVSVNENNDIVVTVRTAVGVPSYTYKSDGVKCQTSLTKTAHKTLLSPTYYKEVFPQNIYEFYGIENISNRIHCASSRECVSSTVVNSNKLNDSLDKLFDVTQFESIHNVSTFLKKTKSMSSLDILYSNVNYCKYKYPEYSDQSFERQTGCMQSSTKLDTAFKNKEQLAVFKLFSFRNRLKRKVKNKTNVDILNESDVNEHCCKDDLPNSDKTLPSSDKTDENSVKIGNKCDTNEIPEKTKSSTKSPENIDKDTSETVMAVNNYREYPETAPVLSNIKIEIESKGNNTDVVKDNSENKQFKDEQNGCGDHIIDKDCYVEERNNNVSSFMLLIPMDDQDSEDSLNTCSSLMLLHLSENFSDRYSSRNISVHAVNIDVQASRSRSLARRCDSWVRSAGTEDAYNCSTPILYSAARGRSKSHKLSVQWSDTSYANNYGMDCGYGRPMHQDYQKSSDMYERSSSRRVRPSPPGFTITRLPKSSREYQQREYQREYQQREYQREYSDWNHEQRKGNQMYDDRGRLACSGCFSSGRLPQAPPPCNNKVLEHRDSSPDKKESKLSKLNVLRGMKWGTKSDTKMQDTTTSTQSYMVFARDEATYCQITPPTSQIFNRTKGKKSIIQSKCNLLRGKKLWGAKSTSKLQDSSTSTHSYVVYGHDQATLCRNIPAITKEDIDTQTLGKKKSKLNRYYNKSATRLSTYFNSTSKLSNCYAESANKLSKYYKEFREKRKSDPKMQDGVTCTHSYAVFGQDQGTLCQVMDNVKPTSSTCVTTGPPYLRIACKASTDATDMEGKCLNIWRGVYKDILNTNINETQSPTYRNEESFHCIETSTIRQKGDLPSLCRDGDMEPHELVGYWESSSQSCTVLPPRPKPQSVIVALRCGSNHCQTDSVNQPYQQICGKKPCHQPYERAYEKPHNEVKTNEDRLCGGAMIIENDCNKNRQCALNANRQDTNLKCSVGSVRQLSQRKPNEGAPKMCEPKINDRGEYVCTPCPGPVKKPPYRSQMIDCGQQRSPEHTRPPNQRMQPSCDPIKDACGCPAEQTMQSTGRRMNCEPKMNACGEYVCTPCPAAEKKPPYRPQMNDCGQQRSPEHTRPPNQRMQPLCDPIKDACGCPAEQTMQSTGRRMNCEPKMNACGEYVCTPCPAAEKKPPYRPKMKDCGQQSRPEYTRPPNQRIQPCDPRVDAREQTKQSTGRKMICEPKMNIRSDHKWTQCRPQMKSCGQQSQQRSPEYTRPPCPRILPSCDPIRDACGCPAEQTRQSTGRRIICDPKINARDVCTPCPAAEKKPPCKPKTSVCGPQRPLEYTRPPCPGLQPSFDAIRDPCGYPAEQTCRRIIEPSCFRTPVRNLSGPSLTKCKPKEYFKLSNVIDNPIPLDACGRPLPRRRRMHGLPECWGPRSPPGSLRRVCGTRITPQCEEQSPWTTGWSRNVPDCSCEANSPRMPCPERTPIGGGLKPPISKLRKKPSRTQEMRIQEVASEVTSGFEMLLGLDVVKHNAQYYERMMKCDGIPVERQMSLKAVCSFLLSPFRRSVECSFEEEKPKENKGFKMKIDAKGSAVLPCNIGSLHQLLCSRNRKGSATDNEVPSRVKSMKTESPGSPVPSIASEPSRMSRILSRVMSKKSLTETAPPLTSQVEAAAETSPPISPEPSRKSRILSRIMSKKPEESTTETSPFISPEPSRKSRILSRIMSTKPEESTSETTPPISAEPSKKSRILSRIMSKNPEEPATETTPPINTEPSRKSRILSRIMSTKPEESSSETTPPISAEPSKKSRLLSRIMSKNPEEPATDTTPPINTEPSRKSRILSRIMSTKPEESTSEITPPISAEPSKKSRILSRIMSKKPEEPASQTTPPISAEPSKKSKNLSKVMSKKPEPAAEATPPISAEPSMKSRILSKIMSKKPEEPLVEPAPPVPPQPSKKSKILSRIMSKKPEEPPPEPPAPVPSKMSKILSRIMSKKPEESPPETPPPEPSKKSKILSKVMSKKPEESPAETPPPEPSKKSKILSKVMSKKPEESPPETPPPEPSKKSKILSKVMSRKPEESPPETPPPEPSKKSKILSKVMSKKPEESPPETPPPEPSKKSKILSKVMSKKPEESPPETPPPEPSKKSKILSKVMSKKPEESPPETPPPEPSKKSKILSKVMSKKPEESTPETPPPEPSKKSKIPSKVMSKKSEESPPETPPPEPSKKSKIPSKVMSKKSEESPPETPPPEPSKKSKIPSKVMSKKPEESPPETPLPEPSKKSKILSKVMSKKPEESPPETPPPEPSKKSKIPSKVMSMKPDESPPETPLPEPSKKSKILSKVMSKKPEESPPETPPPEPSKKSKIPSKAMSKKPEEPPAEPAPVAPEPSKKSKAPSRVKSQPPMEEPPPPPLPLPPPPVEEVPPPEPEIVEEVYPYGTTVEEFEVPYGTVIETEETTITTYI